jgi:hypothetical protein
VLLPVPIEENFEPYAKRRVLRRNQELFVDASRSGGVAVPAASVSPAGFCPRGICPPHEECIGGICFPIR